MAAVARSGRIFVGRSEQQTSPGRSSALLLFISCRSLFISCRSLYRARLADRFVSACYDRPPRIACAQTTGLGFLPRRRRRDGRAHALHRLVEDAPRSRSRPGPRRCARWWAAAANRFPMLLWWGPRYVQLTTTRTGRSRARSTRVDGPARAECWAEIWHIIGPMVEAPFRGGPATWSDDLDLDRPPRLPRGDALQGRLQPGPRRERRPSGIGGVLATVAEMTEKVVRRAAAAALRELGAARRAAQDRPRRRARRRRRRRWPSTPRTFRSPSSICSIETAARRTWPASGLAPERRRRQPASRRRSRRRTAKWPLARVAGSAASRSSTDLRERFARVPGGPWSDPPRHRHRAAARRPTAPHAQRASWSRASARAARSTTATAVSSSWLRGADRDRDRQRARLRGGAASAPRRWRRSTAPRPRSSATSATSSARR